VKPTRLIIAAAAAFYAVFVARTAFLWNGRPCFSLFDDAMVSMRYARNLAEGNGLVWNPGEAPVEGYTNLLWTLWMGLVHLAPVPESTVSLLVMLTGVVILLVNTLVTIAIARRLSGLPGWAAAASAALVAFHFPLVFWTLRGLEVGLLTLLVAMAILFALRWEAVGRVADLIGVAAALAAGVLTRPDAVVPGVVVAAYLTAGAEPRRRKRIVAATFGVLFGAAALHTAFRYAYYGDFFPNAYYLKLTGVPLIDRLGRGIEAFRHSVVVELWPALALLAWGAAALRDRRVRLLIAVFVAQVAYSVVVGGDAWEWTRFANRYLTVGGPALVISAVAASAGIGSSSGPRRAGAWRLLVLGLWMMLEGLLLPAQEQRRFPWFGRYNGPAALGLASCGIGMLFLGGMALLRTNHRWGWRLSRPAPAVLLLLLYAPNYYRWARHSAPLVREDGVMARAGMALQRATEGHVSVAADWAGAIPYFARRPAVDLLGKNDRHVARGPLRAAFYPGHSKWDVEYSIGRLRPDIVVWTRFTTAADRLHLDRLGYERFPNGISVLRAATGVDREAIAAISLFVAEPETSRATARAPRPEGQRVGRWSISGRVRAPVTGQNAPGSSNTGSWVP
jgi:hypothetical protein